jgi:cell wall-associated NlpC family hydrolase
MAWVLGTALAASALLLIPMVPRASAPVENISSAPTGAEAFVITENGAASITKVFDGAGKWLATFTLGARTVAVAGTQRTFAEDTAGAAVITSTYVRLLPEPFTGGVDGVWLRSAMTDTSQDLLAIAAQYSRHAPALSDANGLQTAGDADYGPASEDGKLRKGADFNDYLGIPWDYPGNADPPEPDELGALDCSGFVRMIFGYRGGMPMTREPADGLLPRRSFEMLDAAPGSVIYRSTDQLEELAGIQPGDLVFFNAEPDAASQIDHVGVFVGVDTQGNHRFVSSRKTADGPTMGDEGGRSILNGTGHYAEALRGVRRL